MAKSVKELSLVVNGLQQKIETELSGFRKTLKEATSPEPSLTAKDALTGDLAERLSKFEVEVMQQLNSLKETIERLSDRESRMEERVDKQEQMYNRNKLLLHGMVERDGETAADVFLMVEKTLKDKFGITEDYFARPYILDCYRIGKRQAGANRPIVVTFAAKCFRDDIFVNKSKLKGSKVMCTEYLTKSRLRIFKKCAAIYKKMCWTSNGVIVVLKDGEKKFISSEKQFNDLIRVQNIENQN